MLKYDFKAMKPEKLSFYIEQEINPMDLSRIRIELFKKLSLDKMKTGEICRFYVNEYGQEVVYSIKKLDNENSFFKSYEIKKFLFNRALFDLEVKKQLMNPKIEIKMSEDEFKNFKGIMEDKQCK